MIVRSILLPLGAAMLAGCGGGDRTAPRAARVPVAADWRSIATEADRARLRGWREAWTAATAKVRASGRGGALAPMGALFEPDRAMAEALPPAGDYRCRVFKLGAKAAGLPELSVYPWFGCRIDREGELLSFHKVTGSQRPVGLIFADGARGVFLGTLVLGDETSAMEYGQDSQRDMAGIVERVGDTRWRLVLPYPAFESMLDLIELVPAR